MLSQGRNPPLREGSLTIDPHNLIGLVLAGRYAIREHVFTEILGEVYAARDQRTGRSVRIKVLPTDLVHDQRRFERFGREVTASWLVAHPNTLEVIDWGTAEQSLFLVTEDFGGQTLWEWRETHPCEAEEAAEILAQVASALGAAHAEGVLHRALTPTNVLVARDELGDWRVKVRDFGMADLENETDDFEDTTTLNARLDEVRFVAPEYFGGGGPTRATDLYSLGALMYFLMVGQAPDHAVDGKPPVPSASVPTPGWYDWLVQDLLARRPEDRPGAHTVLRRLEAGAGRRLVRAAAPERDVDTDIGETGVQMGVPVGLVAGLGCVGLSLMGGSTLVMAAMLLFWVQG